MLSPMFFHTGMWANASSGALPHSLSQFGQMLTCYQQKSGIIMTAALTLTNTLFFLPLHAYVLHQGFRRWRLPAAAGSHSDFLAYQAVLVEMISTFGFILICCGVQAKHTHLAVTGISISAVQFSGELVFQILTCAERYLAVIHPVAYLGLKNSRGIRLRNAVVGCCWLLCVSAVSMLFIQGRAANGAFYFALLSCSLAAVSFFSFSVLRALLRPRAAEVASSGQQVDPQKMRAFRMMMAILSVLMLKFAGNLFSTTTYVYFSDFASQCISWMATLWLNIPSTLVIPLLYVQRQRKAQCRNRRE